MRRTLLVACLALIIAVHLFFAAGTMAAMCILPFVAPWSVWVPVCTLAFRLVFSREGDCPVTRLENAVRTRLGLKAIGGFIGHYVRRHPRRWFTRAA